MKRSSFQISTDFQSARAPEALNAVSQWDKIISFLQIHGREDLIPTQPKRSATRGYAASWR